MAKQYYVTVESRPRSIEVVRIDTYPTAEQAYNDALEHVTFLRSVGQRPRPHGKLETKPLLEALASWPMHVLRAVAGARYGALGDRLRARGLRPLGDGTDSYVAAINRCAMYSWWAGRRRRRHARLLGAATARGKQP